MMESRLMCLRTDSEITQPCGCVWFGSFMELRAQVGKFTSGCVVGVRHLVAETGENTVL